MSKKTPDYVMRAGVNKQDTRHGQLDMPFTDLLPYTKKKERTKMKKADAIKPGAKPKGFGAAIKGFKKGGSIDGVAKRGHTKGTVIKMRKGGKACS